MALSITIDQSDVALWESLRAEAARRGLEVDALVKELLREGLRPATTAGATPPHHDLDTLAGTWSEEEAESFLSAIEYFQQVDEER